MGIRVGVRLEEGKTEIAWSHQGEIVKSVRDSPVVNL